MTKNTRVDDAILKLEELHSRHGLREREPEFSQLPLYKPLTMSTLSRGECERLVRRTAHGREA